MRMDEETRARPVSAGSRAGADRWPVVMGRIWVPAGWRSRLSRRAAAGRVPGHPGLELAAGADGGLELRRGLVNVPRRPEAYGGAARDDYELGNVGPRVSPYHVSLGMAGRQVSGAAQARITGAYPAPADG